jgi:uncharacterized protein
MLDAQRGVENHTLRFNPKATITVCPRDSETPLAEGTLGQMMQAVAEGTRWMLRLDQGQDLLVALTDFAREHEIRAAAVVSGIGMLRDAAIGYWNGSEYVRKELPEPHELVGLQGSIADADGPSVHLHAALAAPSHQLLGGHLMRGTVWVLNEILIDTFPGRVFGRPIDETLGLRKLDLEPTRLSAP